MVRAALAWLGAGAVAGLAMMADRFLPGAWRAWLAPTHGHMLFVGWFLQFTLGIAFWLLPRTRSPQRPLGYSERWGVAAAALINAGLALRVVAEPLTRTGRDALWLDLTLVGSGLAQVLAVGIVARELWPRLAPRAPRRQSDSSS